ncbi:MAG: alpha/beta hydrolase [Clostridiales bacterium]|nr:alpha/beta hydrolase [Clostridiales bacterium]
MQGWMIALIVIAAVIFVVAAAVLICSLFVFHKILGRRKGGDTEEFPEKYAVDLSWFDTVKDCTETVELTAYDGVKLRALLIKHPTAEGEGEGEDSADKKPSRVAILQHGYRATPNAMQPYAAILYDKGYDILLPAARGHAMSEGKFIGMAWIDRFDFLRWADRVVELYGESVKIAIMGVSMGGSTVVAAAGMNPPPQIKCVIDDCGFSSQRDEYYACLKRAHLPQKLGLIPLAIGVRLRCGYSVYEADIAPLAKKMTIPALFIHGDKDTFVPCELGKALFEACGSEQKEMLVVEGAPHAASYATDKEKYTNMLVEFVDKHIGE